MSKVENNQPPAAGDKILTIEQLRQQHPDLVEQIEEEVVASINNSAADQAKKHLPDLYQRIVDSLKPKDILSDIDGFRLDLKDPFALGTLRTFMAIKKVDGLELPNVLPYKDKATKEALASYILRAEGGGRRDLAEKAQEALKKCK